MTQEVAPLARHLAVPYYASALPAHDQFHANRVRTVALRLAASCERAVDRDIVAAAAWLHDVGRPLERTGAIDHHNQWGAVEAEALLKRREVPTDRIDAITHCIRAHSIRSSSPEPETIEAKLVFDADKLDATGAVGIVRLACIVGERSGREGTKHAVIGSDTAADELSPDEPDITLLRDWAEERLEQLYTEPGRELGASRWEFTNEFFTRLDTEIAGGRTD